MNDEERNQTFLSASASSRNRKRNHLTYQSSTMSLEPNPVVLPVDNPECSAAKQRRLVPDVNVNMPPHGLRINRRVAPCPYYSPPLPPLNTRYFPVFGFGGFNEGKAPEQPMPMPNLVPSPMQRVDGPEDDHMLPGTSWDGRNTYREDDSMLSSTNEENNFREREELPSQRSSVENFTNPEGRPRLRIRIFVKLPELPNTSIGQGGENNIPDPNASGDSAMEID